MDPIEERDVEKFKAMLAMPEIKKIVIEIVEENRQCVLIEQESRIIKEQIISLKETDNA